ncbi:MAG: hypothetical protein QM664_04355 [Flavihumibacter sp.]
MAAITMKNSLLLIPMLLACLAGNSQVRYFVQGGANLGLLPVTENGALYTLEGSNPPAQMAIGTKSTFAKRPGGYLSAGIQYEARPRLYLEGTLSFSLLRYRQQNEYHTAISVGDIDGLPGGYHSRSMMKFYQAGSPLPPADFDPPAGMSFPGNHVVQSAEHGKANKAGLAQLLYADLAFTAKYRFWQRSSIGLGGGISGLLSGSAINPRREYKASEISPNEISRIDIYYEKHGLLDNLKPFAAFLQGVLEQGLNDNWSVQAGFSYYLSPLYKNIPPELNSDKTKIRALTLGARYYFRRR